LSRSAERLPGTLDLLILKSVSLGTLHGYAVLLRIEQITGGALRVQQGALYPALYRLELQGLIESEWGVSDNNRRAKYLQADPGRAAAAPRRVGKLEPIGRGHGGGASGH
jgi:PadR family transcriptional regulator PadR